ncbi:MAG TPA: hypothetical protein VKR52_04450 [Terracidiphilus sp.]|nr:hypothetical protein [Terracidiphilus sp.]
MLRKRSHLVAALLAVGLLFGPRLFADDLQSVLHQLDVSAANFRSASADFEFDAVITDPVPDTDVQKGVAYFEHAGNTFRMAGHINDVNGKSVPKVYMYSNGAVELYEPMINQVTRFKKASQFEGYAMLGFGASGKELEEKWNITYDGPETIDSVKTDKLELVAKDPAVRKTFSKITIWVDPQRNVSVKQVFDEGEGQSRTCHYFNFKVNQSLPGDAFKLKTNNKTQIVDR